MTAAELKMPDGTALADLPPPPTRSSSYRSGGSSLANDAILETMVWHDDEVHVQELSVDSSLGE